MRFRLHDTVSTLTLAVCAFGAAAALPAAAWADPPDRTITFDQLPGGAAPVNGAPVLDTLLEDALDARDTDLTFVSPPPNEGGSRPFALSTEDNFRTATILRFVNAAPPHDDAPRQRVGLKLLSIGRSRIVVTPIDENDEPIPGIDPAIIDGRSGTLIGSGPWERTQGPQDNLDLLGIGYVDEISFEASPIHGLNITATHLAPSDDIFIDDLTIAQDNCPFLDNEDQRDIDGDFVGDPCDDDIDGDDILNDDDNCPENFNPDQIDGDDDGLGDECSPDPDEDGVPTDFDGDGELEQPCRTGQDAFCDDNCPRVFNPDQRDGDEDGLGDVCDDDRDGDNFPNDEDTCPETANSDQSDFDNDGLGDICDDDIDGDQALNAQDNCPRTPNTDQTDTDRDAQGDVCDDDDDGDSIPDDSDNCPLINNPDQPDDDMDGIGDQCDDDGDNDGVSDDDDNCPTTDNADQTDNDGDGDGDACDIDDDNDGLDDFNDNCPLRANEDQTDLDNDQIGDACDDDPDGDTFRGDDDNCPRDFNPDQTDSDNDGIGDICSAATPPTQTQDDGGCQLNDSPTPGSPTHPTPTLPVLFSIGLLTLCATRRRPL